MVTLVTAAEVVFALGLLQLSSAFNISLTADSPLKILPDDDGQLNPNTFLSCYIESPNPDNLTSWWILPDGTTVGFTRLPSKRFLVSQGQASLGIEENRYATILLILSVSHRDAGMYQCVVTGRESDGAENPLSSDVIKLELRTTLHIWENRVTVLNSEAFVDLNCEMREFLRPDRELQWLTDENIIVSDNTKYMITYREGQPGTAQNGHSTLDAGRVAVLTILNPTRSDSGYYTCRVRGTEVRESVLLEVLHGATVESTGALQPSQTPQLCLNGEKLDCVRETILAIGSTFVMTTILMAIVMWVLILYCQRLQLSRLRGIQKGLADIRPERHSSSTRAGSSAPAVATYAGKTDFEDGRISETYKTVELNTDLEGEDFEKC